MQRIVSPCGERKGNAEADISRQTRILVDQIHRQGAGRAMVERPGHGGDVPVRERPTGRLGGHERRIAVPRTKGHGRRETGVQAIQGQLVKIYTRWTRGRRKAPNWPEIAKEVKRTMDKTVKPELVKEFEKVVAKWEHKVQFGAMKKVRQAYTSVYVFPKGPDKKIWTFVSGGTKAHAIPKKSGAKTLSFVWGGPGSYVPKTAPGVYGGPGIVISGKPVAFKSVWHPGTKPRNFEHHIRERYKPQFQKHMENAMRRGVRRAHAGT